MKLEKFNEVCKRKWDNGRGVVAELWLTEESFDELYADILIHRAGPVTIVHPHWSLLNPATKDEVKVRTYEGGRDLVLTHYRGRRSEKRDADELPCSR
jgi:hypothetical protein